MNSKVIFLIDSNKNEKTEIKANWELIEYGIKGYPNPFPHDSFNFESFVNFMTSFHTLAFLSEGGLTSFVLLADLVNHENVDSFYDTCLKEIKAKYHPTEDEYNSENPNQIPN